jgi:hypothetical protein
MKTLVTLIRSKCCSDTCSRLTNIGQSDQPTPVAERREADEITALSRMQCWKRIWNELQEANNVKSCTDQDIQLIILFSGLAKAAELLLIILRVISMISLVICPLTENGEALKLSDVLFHRPISNHSMDPPEAETHRPRLWTHCLTRVQEISVRGWI